MRRKTSKEIEAEIEIKEREIMDYFRRIAEALENIAGELLLRRNP